MKNKFRMAMMLSLACGAFAFTGCTDYEEDINAINNRIDALETGKLASVEEQIKALQTTQGSLQTTVAALEKFDEEISGKFEGLKGDVATLRTDFTDQTNSFKEQLEALDGKVDGNFTTLKKQIEDGLEDVNSTITGLTGRVTALESFQSQIQASHDALVGTVEGITNRVDGIDGRLDVLDATIETLATKDQVIDIEEKLGALTGRVGALEANVEGISQDVADNKAAIENLTYALGALEVLVGQQDAALQASIDALQESLNTTNEKLADLSADLTAKYNELNDAIAAVKETADKAAGDAASALAKIASLENAFNAFKTTQEQKNAAFDSAIDDLGSRLGTAETSIDDIEAAIADINAELDTKFNTADFNKYFTEQLNAALADGGAITNAISAAIAQLTTDFNAKIDEIVEDYETLTNRVDDLASRIQSLVFVPEYSDGLATATAYMIGSTPVDGNMTVSATFQVTPKEYAKYLTSENTFVSSVSVKTRAAEAAVLQSAKILSTDPATGYVNVEAVLPIPADGKAASIALYVADSKPAGTEEKPVDDGSFVSSEYVGVAEEVEVDLSGKYVLYNGEVEYASNTALSYQAEWTAAPDEHKFFEGFELCLKLDENGTPVALAKAAERLNVAVEAISPKLEPSVDYAIGNNWDLEDSKESVVKKYFIVNKPADNISGMSISMDAAEDLSKAINRKAKVTYVFKMGETKVLENISAEYTIVKDKSNASLAEQKVDWTYEYALTHAVVLPTFPSQMVPNALPAKFENIALTIDDDVLPATIATIPSKTSKDKVTLNDAEFSGDVVPGLTIESIDAEAKTATVSVSGYTFSSDKENVYEFTKEYNLNNTALTLTFKVTFGQLPAKQTVDFGEVQTELFTTGFKSLPVADLESKALEGVATYFKDGAEFASALFHESNTVTKSAKRGETDLDLEFNKFEVLPEGASYLRLSSSVINAKEDKFAYTTTVDTWFGVPFEFKAAIALTVPALDIVPSPEFANENFEVTVNGDVVDGKYTINKADLSKYIKVTGLTDQIMSDNLNTVNVKYTVLTVADPVAGIINVPTPNVPTASVNADGSIVESILPWLPRNGNPEDNFSGRELKVRAALTLGNIEIVSKDLTLTTKDVISSVSATGLNAERQPKKDVVVKMWQGLSALDYLGAEQVNRAAGGLNKALVNPTLYGMNITFGSDVTVYLNGEVYDYEKSKYNFNAATGVLTVYGEDAEQIGTLRFEVDVTVNSVLNYNGVNQPQRTVKAYVDIVAAK